MLEAQEPDGPRRDEIEAILSSLTDLREVWDEAEPESMMELFGAYDLAVTYDKPAGTLGPCSASKAASSSGVASRAPVLSSIAFQEVSGTEIRN